MLLFMFPSFFFSYFSMCNNYIFHVFFHIFVKYMSDLINVLYRFNKHSIDDLYTILWVYFIIVFFPIMLH